jgi:hypothetical protein
MRNAIGIVVTLMLAGVLGTGCGGGNGCEDLVTAINKASMQPGCAAGLASVMQQEQQIIATCDPANSGLQEKEAICFNAVGSCEPDANKTLLALDECLAAALAGMM